MEIKIPKIKEWPKGGAAIIRWLFEMVALVIMGFLMPGMVMNFIPGIPKLWGTPQDAAWSLIAVTGVYLAMRYAAQKKA